MTPTAVVLAFIDAINGRNLDAMLGLMTDDHRFIDALGAEVTGRKEMRKAWVAYTLMVPDYRIVVEHALERGDCVAVFGKASGTLSIAHLRGADPRWEIPAAWRVVVRGSLISEWQVYADNEPVRSLMDSPR